MPMLGLMQAVRFCESGNDFSYYLNCDTAIDFANRQFEIRSNRPIPILDRNRGTICGVKVNLREPIRDKKTQEEIKSLLGRLTFNVEYKTNVPEQIKKWKDKGKSEREIDRMCTQIRKNKTMKIDQEKNCSIIWDASDPNLHSFKFKTKKEPDAPERTVTVADYFNLRYNVRLNFPHMPMVFIGNREWFPIEFLFQAFSKKRAPPDSTKKAVLQYYNDVNAGTNCVTNIKELTDRAMRRLEKLGLNVEKVLSMYNLRMSNDPVKVEARVLDEPKISFANNMSKQINNGSWDLRNVKFYEAAAMNSFVVVDLTGNMGTAREFTNNFLRVASNHGMDVPSMFTDRSDRSGRLDDLILSRPCRGNDTGAVGKIIDEAVTRAKHFFIDDSSNWFKNNGVWFESRVRHPIEGRLCKCLVLPYDGEGKDVPIILTQDEERFTHTVTFEGETHQARPMRKVVCLEAPVDPFHFRYSEYYSKFDVLISFIIPTTFS